MIVSEVFAGKTYAVLGLARSGLATVETLLASGARVVAWDSQEMARAAAIALGRSSRAKSRDDCRNANVSRLGLTRTVSGFENI